MEKLVEIAKIQSTEASNAIEGIVTTNTRIKQLVEEKTTPRNRDEQEIAGYRDVLNVIHESFDAIPITQNYILQIHKMLYSHMNNPLAGRTKSMQNYISAAYPDGHTEILFTPLAPYETSESLDRICEEYNRVIGNLEVEPLIIIPIFIHDFLCIHPFNDGNGRMSRLLTLLLYYRAGYIVGKYISIEKLIETTKEEYYECLRQSSEQWHENENDYEPFVKYMLSIMIAAYRDFSSRVNLLTTSGMSKPDRVKEIIRTTPGQITKMEILKMCPDISQVTVQRALADLLSSGEILKIGGGRYTKYTWNNN